MSVDIIRKSADEGKLVVIFGAGASIALTQKSKKALSWIDLVRSGLDHARARGFVKDIQHNRYIDALQSDDIDELLGAAEFIGRKLDAPSGDQYARWLQSTFEGWLPDQGGMQNALRTIVEKEIPIATLNYDTLIELSTGLQSIDFADTQHLMPWLRKETKGILHLHGVWTNPKNCIFGIRDYANALNDQLRLNVQRSLGSLNRILFVGCGETFADPNFSSLIHWLRSNLGANFPQHYALVRDNEASKKFADPLWQGFVDPLAYGPNYSDLPGFLLSCFPTRRSSKAAVSKQKSAAVQSAQVIDTYRNFLMRDCGQMAIEGMPGDMDTGQRKFDIEKLFVPLEVVGLAPAIPEDEENKDAITKEWVEIHSEPEDFSTVFANEQRIALLALPGGGKTLLLKRLAVAYANPSRRASSLDQLPEMALIPLMIRCREWKEYIRQPIPTLIKNISSITGEGSIANLGDALEKHLKSGSVLLLVDGLDEIHNDSDRTIFVENLERFLEDFPKVRFVVTSREAGFELIAPCLSRFCSKFRIAPLNPNAIVRLCEYWHRLMGGGTPDALREAEEVAQTLLGTSSLRLLAGNPLLCTMLLVVKHGFGRLPSDRVTLYERAVELLLDTWNIKGHDALNVKEAVPQLACVAFELLKRGKQTATEKELLEILEEARKNLPMIGRYAKDSPHAFIKRVELRSSLVLQGGLRKEGLKVVPFYQFRHLTFQEYLAAVAAVEGYTLASEKPSSIIKAIGDNLLSDEWKEVIPMAACLGRSQSAPLLDALVSEALAEKNDFISKNTNFLRFSPETLLPPATGRIAQSMIEEADFSPDNIDKAAPIVALFANGCGAAENWQALIQGPYGPDLRSAALNIFMHEPYSHRCHARNTVALFEAMTRPASYWRSKDCVSNIINIPNESDEAILVKSLLSIPGSFWLHSSESALASSDEVYQKIEFHLFNNSKKVQISAAWAWGFWRHLKLENKKKVPVPDDNILRLFVTMFLDRAAENMEMGRFTLPNLSGVARNSFDMQLSPKQDKVLRELMKEAPTQSMIDRSENHLATARIGFILKDFISDAGLIEYIKSYRPLGSGMTRMNEMLADLGEPTARKKRRK